MTTRKGRKLDVELGEVRQVHAVLEAGELTVVAAPSAPRLEAEVLRGPPLSVEVAGKTVTIRHRRRWPLRWISPVRDARASVVVFVPVECSTSAVSVSADVLVSGTTGDVEVRNVSGSLTLTGVSGSVVAKNVSGPVDAEGIDGQLTVKCVSGDVTASGRLEGVVVRAVSGAVTLDLGHAADVSVKSVSGDVSIRLPADAALSVRANTTSGRLDSAFDFDGDIRRGHVSGRIGSANGGTEGIVKVETVSGDLALLRRADDAEPPEAEAV